MAAKTVRRDRPTDRPTDRQCTRSQWRMRRQYSLCEEPRGARVKCPHSWRSHRLSACWRARACLPAGAQEYKKEHPEDDLTQEDLDALRRTGGRI